MIQIKGPPSHSPFRLQQLLEDLRKLNDSIENLGARYTHFIDSTNQLDQKELEVLKVLLAYGPDWDMGPEDGQKIIVIPRLGTISPWSSKATDIARLSGTVFSAQCRVRSSRESQQSTNTELGPSEDKHDHQHHCSTTQLHLQPIYLLLTSSQVRNILPVRHSTLSQSQEQK